MMLRRWARSESNCNLLCAMRARRVMPSLSGIRIRLRCRRCVRFCQRPMRKEYAWFSSRKLCTKGRLGAGVNRDDISVVFFCFFFFLLFSFRFLHTHFRGALLQRGLSEKTFGKTGIVLARLEENLVDATTITIERDLQRGPHPVHQLIIRVNARLHAAVGRRIVL